LEGNKGAVLGATHSLAGGAYDVSGASEFTPVTLPLELRVVGDQISGYLNGALVLGPVTDATYTDAGGPGIHGRQSDDSDQFTWDTLIVEPLSSADYTVRKGSTAVPITHTLTAGGITSQTFNGETVALASQSGQIANVDFTDTITTSGVYTLTLGDGTNTENFDVQYNVIGLPSSTLKKEGASLGSLTDLEAVYMTGGLPPRSILEQASGITTDAQGSTGKLIISNPSAVLGNNVNVFLKSFNNGVGIAFGAPLELL